MTDEPTEPSDPDQEPAMRDDTTPDEPKENIVHFNPWRDFNDAAPQIDVFGDEPDPAQIAQFMQVEPHRICRRLQLLSRMEHHEQDNEQVFPRSA